MSDGVGRQAMSATRPRYLTADWRRLVLTEWRDTLAKTPRTTPETGGRGFVDEEIVLWCERINTVPRVITLQSCTGHAARDGEGASDGCLWLWPDQVMAGHLYKRMPEMAAIPSMTRCRLLWQPDGQEVVDLNFRGPAQGVPLEQTLEPVLGVLWR